MGYVFISYSREDAVFVTFLAGSLRRRKIKYWLDIENIKPTDEWDNVIHEALKNAECLVVVLSPPSMASPEVGAEWKYALHRKIPIIPIYLHTTDIHYRLFPINYIDFRGEYNDGLHKLVEVLAKLVTGEVIRSIPVPVENNPAPYQEMLKDESWHVRLDAVDMLLKMGVGAGLLALIQALNDEHPYVVKRALEGLSNFQNKGAFLNHLTFNIGTGIFRDVLIFDRLSPLADPKQYPKIQTMEITAQVSIFDLPLNGVRQKWQAEYNTAMCWFKIRWDKIAYLAGSKYDEGWLNIYVNEREIGKLNLKLLAENSFAQKHGFICELPIHINDEFYLVCWGRVRGWYSVKENLWYPIFDVTKRFLDDPICSVVIGPDMYYRYATG